MLTTPSLRSALLLAALLAVGCPTTVDDDDSAVDDSTDDDDSGDDDDSTATQATGITVSANVTELSTRQWVTVTVTAQFDDSTQVIVSTESSITSSDEDVVRFYLYNVGQPLSGGTTDIGATWRGFEADPVSVTVTVVPAEPGDLVLNELLIDGTVDGDPNGDGSFDGVEDEFVEIANAGAVSVDLGGVTITDLDFPGLPRHTFPADTLLRPGEAVVVFGGGDPSNLAAANAQFSTALNDDSGTPVGLDLRDLGDTITLLAATGAVIDSVSWGDAPGATVDSPADESLQRDPDVTGSTWEGHSASTGAAGSFSPGTRADGLEFGGPDSWFQ